MQGTSRGRAADGETTRTVKHSLRLASHSAPDAISKPSGCREAMTSSAPSQWRQSLHALEQVGRYRCDSGVCEGAEECIVAENERMTNVSRVFRIHGMFNLL